MGNDHIPRIISVLWIVRTIIAKINTSKCATCGKLVSVNFLLSEKVQVWETHMIVGIQEAVRTQ